MIEDMLAARGVIVSHQTVRLWAEKFGRHFANDIRKPSAGRLGDKWHLDEVAIAIGWFYRNDELWVEAKARLEPTGLFSGDDPGSHIFASLSAQRPL